MCGPSRLQNFSVQLISKQSCKTFEGSATRMNFYQELETRLEMKLTNAKLNDFSKNLRVRRRFDD